jgi:Protein of unknown function (DUF1572)
MIEQNYLNSLDKQFRYYKNIGEKAMAQLDEAQLHWQFNEESNSIAMIVQHLAGNMLSRFTDFLTSDGEKPWRNRDAEFEGQQQSPDEVLALWQKGWDCFFTALNSLKTEDLDQIVYIRNEGHTVTEALNRQLAHYPYHIGQIVFVAKMLKNNDWQTLSIAKNKSQAFNEDKFSKEKSIKHFTA